MANGMNERIQELMTQCETKYSTASEPTYDMEKFAELIVRECANRASWAQDTGEEDIGGEVLKHFGVE